MTGMRVDYFLMADNPERTCAVSAAGIVFPSPEMQGVESQPLRPLDAVKLKRTNRLACPVGF
jgi:hypothetical protein